MANKTGGRPTGQGFQFVMELGTANADGPPQFIDAELQFFPDW